MKKSNKINAVAATALAMATFVAASAFADSRPTQETWRARAAYSRGYANDGYVRGVVDRVNYRYGTLVLRDRRSNALITVDMRATARRSRIDLNDLRRGDLVSLNGNWSRDGVFRAYEIDGVQTGRY